MATIMAQTFGDWELIVCDSFSDDGTWEYLQQFKDDSRVRLYQVPREGLYAGWNECLKRCRGEYVYIATADDTMEPECLEKMVAALDAAQTAGRRPQTVDLLGRVESRESGWPRPVDIAVCRYEKIDEDGKVIPRVPGDLERFYGDLLNMNHCRDGLTELLVLLCLGCNWETVTSVVFRRSLLDKTGLFRTDCGAHADIAWRIKAVLHSNLICLPELLATWRIHEKQATANRPADAHRQYLALTAETLCECANLLPDGWKQDPKWMERLLFHSRAVWLRSLGVDRFVLRTNPTRFMTNLVKAVRHEPKFILRRLLSGFSWNAPEYGNDVDYLKWLKSYLADCCRGYYDE